MYSKAPWDNPGSFTAEIQFGDLYLTIAPIVILGIISLMSRKKKE